ncbi:unnamed protein product [Musa textilis]
MEFPFGHHGHHHHRRDEEEEREEHRYPPPGHHHDYGQAPPPASFFSGGGGGGSTAGPPTRLSSTCPTRADPGSTSPTLTLPLPATTAGVAANTSITIAPSIPREPTTWAATKDGRRSPRGLASLP